MFPIVLDLHKANVLVIGDGPAAARRVESLRAAGCEAVWIKKWGAGCRVPGAEGDKATAHSTQHTALFIFIADFDVKTSREIYAWGKKAGALVNVEDKAEFCDFHVPAMIRRGDLLVTVSTGGKSPRLARRLRQWLEELIVPEWKDRLEEIGAKRQKWKQKGDGIEVLAKKTDDLLKKKGWL